MTSYHDLKKQVYDKIRAAPFTRIHGLPSWQDKEKLVKECQKHGGFGCTIRYVPLRWLAIGFRAFDTLFYNRNSVRSYQDPTEIARMFASAVFCQHEAKSEPFRMRFAYFSVVFQESNIKRVKSGNKLQ